MKIATYNLWNHSAGMPHRREQIISVLSSLNADVLCLQEDFFGECLPQLLPDYPYHMHHPDAELSVMSKYPIQNSHCMLYALVLTVSCGIHALCIINVHLPWQRALLREEAIISVTDMAAAVQADYTLLAGDFNCSDTSAVHRFLLGEQSLHGHDAYYFDLSEAFAAMTNTVPEVTLDFRSNPRFGVVDAPNTIEKNQRFDRILLKNPYPSKMPILTDCGIFGTEISPITQLTASDHWGVYASLDF